MIVSLFILALFVAIGFSLSIDPVESSTPRVQVSQLKRDLSSFGGEHQNSHGNDNRRTILHYNHNFGPPPPEIRNQINDAFPAPLPPPPSQFTFPSTFRPPTPVSPIPIKPDGIVVGPRGLVDFSDARTDPETGMLCVIKEDLIDSLRKDPILKCDHLKVRQCHFTYITKFSSNQEEVCDDNFEKICQIVFRQEAANTTARKCYRPMEVVCDGDGQQQDYPQPSYGFDRSFNVFLGDGRSSNSIGGAEEVCKTFYETVCTTRYRETQPGKSVGDTRCQKIPRQLCGKPSCRAVEGPEECHDVQVAAVTDVPEETCDLNPRKTCRLETRLVPRLEPVEDCRYRPRQVCHVDFDLPKKEKRPLKVKLCMKEGQTVLPPPPPPLPYVPPRAPSAPPVFPDSYGPPPSKTTPRPPFPPPIPYYRPRGQRETLSSTYSASTLSTLNVI